VGTLNKYLMILRYLKRKRGEETSRQRYLLPRNSKKRLESGTVGERSSFKIEVQERMEKGHKNLMSSGREGRGRGRGKR